MFTLCVNSTYTASVTDYPLGDVYGLGYRKLTMNRIEYATRQKCIHLIFLPNKILQNLINFKAKDVMYLGVASWKLVFFIFLLAYVNFRY